ncbi:MAG: GNAT family N-acetyltransferase [Proteobacteria bacterium]|nr:GNAT family N-acetyltransferase [Pseudomonadota bacterium]
MTKLRKLEKQDYEVISNAFTNIGWNKPVELFERYFEEQLQGLRFCFVAFCDDTFVGYTTLLKTSKYEYFASGSIPEISDLNVLPNFRKQGIGTTLIKECEKIAKEFSDKIGLGVGLTADYANALNLYLKLGYHFDNKGIAYCGRTLSYNQSAIVDDELNLYLIKTWLLTS